LKVWASTYDLNFWLDFLARLFETFYQDRKIVLLGGNIIFLIQLVFGGKGYVTINSKQVRVDNNFKKIFVFLYIIFLSKKDLFYFIEQVMLTTWHDIFSF